MRCDGAELPYLAYISGNDTSLGSTSLKQMIATFDTIAIRQEEIVATATSEIVGFMRGIVRQMRGSATAESIVSSVLRGELDQREGDGTTAALLDRIAPLQHWSFCTGPLLQEITPGRRQVLANMASEALELGGATFLNLPRGQRKGEWEAKGSQLFWLGAARNRICPEDTEPGLRLRGRAKMSWGGDAEGGLIFQMQTVG
jgi:hypothetical protein